MKNAYRSFEATLTAAGSLLTAPCSVQDPNAPGAATVTGSALAVALTRPGPGSSQATANAITAADAVAPSSKIQWVSNGGPRQALQAVSNEKWGGAICVMERTVDANATTAGVAKEGGCGPTSRDPVAAPVKINCTTQWVGNLEGEYSE